MSGRWVMLVALAVVMIAGLAAGSLLLRPDGAEAHDHGRLADACSAAGVGASPLDQATEQESSPCAAVGGREPSAGDNAQSLGDPIDEDYESLRGGPREPGGPDPAAPGQPQQPVVPLPGGSVGPGAPPAPSVDQPQPQPAGLPSSARDPTPRETAARARYGGTGRLPQAGSLPDEAKTDSEQLPLDLTKLAEPEIWTEYWSREGYSAPAMVKTPVRGKVMSLLTNTQLPRAKVRVFTFFPAGSMPSGPVLPVVMEALTDEQGFFESNLPTPARWPDNYPRFALSVEFDGKRVVDCAVYDSLRGGEHNEIGVFWAPEEPFELEVSAVTQEQGLTVAATGRLDPRRWEARRAKSIFPVFGATPVGVAGAKLIGTWDFLADPPYVSLLRNGEQVLTRQCARTANEVVRGKLDGVTTALFFEEETLDGVLAKLSIDGEISITHTPAVEGDQPLTLDVGRVRLRQALDLVADAAELSWRIENGAVVFDIAGDPTAEHREPEIGKPFQPVIFPNDGKLALSGTVVDAGGVTIEGAELRLTVDGALRVIYTDSSGWFSFTGLREGQYSLNVQHELYVGFERAVLAGVTDLKLTLNELKPRVALRVVADSDGLPVREIWVRFHAWPDNTGIMDHPPAEQVRAMTSPDGNYLFEHDLPLIDLHVTAPGRKPAEVEFEAATGVIEVRLLEGQKLERRPRDYSAAQTPSLFQTDEGDGPGLWSLDDDHWVEYALDFGETAANFDLILGVTNHTYGTLPLDNEYLFEVDVWLDGKKVGRLNIGSDPAVQQLGRIGLGSLSGEHTIRLMWLNDRYIPGQLDANIRYESIRFIEVP